MILLALVLFSLLNVYMVNSHGYVCSPIDRPLKCYSDGGFYYPTDGSGIKDPQCRAAYQYIYERVFNQSQDESLAIRTAQNAFVQKNEFAAIAGPNYDDMHHIQTEVLNKDLCSCNADDYTTQYGDKSGFSIPGNWYKNKIPIRKEAESTNLTIEYCATAPHNPSIFRVYQTRKGFNPKKDKLKWHHLHLIYNQTNVPITKPQCKLCDSGSAYVLEIPELKYVYEGIIYIYWQRLDRAGELFCHCIDFHMQEYEYMKPYDNCKTEL